MKINKFLYTLVLSFSFSNYLYADSLKEPFGINAVDVLTIGKEYNYIENVNHSFDDSSPFEIEMSKKFGAYRDFKDSNTVFTGKVWLGTVVKKTKENKCFAITKYVEKDYMKIGEPETKQAIDEIQCEEIPSAKAKNLSKTLDNKDIGFFQGDEKIIKSEVVSEEYQSDGSFRKVVIFEYLNNERKQCVFSLGNYKDVVPKKRTCYPYYGF